MILVPVKGMQLRPGMHIRREQNLLENPQTVPEYTGQCEKGWHFGNGCYDHIATWYIPFGE